MATLQFDRLTKRFGETAAVDRVSLSIGDGELVCLLGPSGCGKSTVLRMIGGFETPSGGRIAIDGADIGALPPNRRPTGMVFQSHALWPHMTVSRNIAFGLRLRPLSRGEVGRRVDGVLDLVGLYRLHGNRYPGQLSGGQQQRVAIARCVVLEPKILLMDEPSPPSTPISGCGCARRCGRSSAALGLTTVFVTHDQEEAMTLADRIVVMKDGRIEQVGRPGEIYARPETEFVAGFIGTMTLAEARVEAGRLRWHGPAAPCDLPDGPATLALRPEDLVPVAAPARRTPSPAGSRPALVDLGAVRHGRCGDRGRHRAQAAARPGRRDRRGRRGDAAADPRVAPCSKIFLNLAGSFSRLPAPARPTAGTATAQQYLHSAPAGSSLLTTRPPAKRPGYNDFGRGEP